MSDLDHDEAVHRVLDVRKVGADYEEHQQANPLDIPVDLHNFKKFPVIDPPGTHTPSGEDTRGDIQPDTSSELPDYSGPFRPDLRFSDFSNEALVNMLAMSDEYYRVCVLAWAGEVANRYGPHRRGSAPHSSPRPTQHRCARRSAPWMNTDH